MGADSCLAVCRFGACADHALPLCLRCARSFVSVAWRGVAFLQRSVSLGSRLILVGLTSVRVALRFSLGSVKRFFWSKWFSFPLFLLFPVVVDPLLESF